MLAIGGVNKCSENAVNGAKASYIWPMEMCL